MARPTGEPLFLKVALVLLALAFLALFLVVPLAIVFVQALEKGALAYFAAVREPETLQALRLTVLAALVAVPLNLVFGICAAWAIAKFDFPGKSALASLIDLPFAISPVVSGLVFVLLFGRTGLLGPWLADHGLKVIFAV